MWNRWIILLSAYLGSAVGFFYPLVIAGVFGVEYTSLWLGTRAIVQFSIALMPNYINSLLYFNSSDRVDRVFYIKKGGGLAFFLYLLVGLFFVLLANGLVSEYVIEILFFGFCFVLSGYTLIFLRIEKRSDLIFNISKMDLVASAVLLFFISYTEEFGLLFILAGLKELAKSFYIFFFLRKNFKSGYSNNDRYSHILKSYSINHVYRSSYQVLSQHGDRFIFPLVFGLTVSGQAAIGSSFAMILVSLSSSAFSWALPSAVKNINMSGYILTEWRKLVVAASLLSCVFLFLLDIFNDSLSGYLSILNNLEAVTISSFLFSSLLGVTFILTLLEKKRLRSFRFVFFSVLIIFFSYLTIFVFVWVVGFSIDKAIIMGAVVFMVSIMLHNEKYFSWKDYLAIGFSVSIMIAIVII